LKVEGKKLLGQMARLSTAQRAEMVKVISKNTHEAAQVTRMLAPSQSNKTREDITTVFRDGGLTGEVVVIASDASKADKDRAYSIEHGRKAGDKGTTEGYHHVYQARKYLGKKFAGRVRRAIKKTIKAL
jgi:hypothetical protein